MYIASTGNGRFATCFPGAGNPSMKICIVSDSHDHRGHLAAAVADAKARGAEAVLHCGDLVAPSTLHAV